MAAPNEKPENKANKATDPAPGERESTPPPKPDQDNTYLTWDTEGEGWDQGAKETTR